MGKSSKKANVEVSAPALSVPSEKSGKKGKRDADEALVKAVSAKKQKKDAEVVVAKQKGNGEKKSKKVSEKPPPKKKVETSSDDSTTSESEEEVKIPPKKQNKAGKIPPKKEASSSSEDSSSDEDVKKLPAKVAPVVATKKKQESSESSESDSEDEVAPAVNKQTVSVAGGKKEESTDSSDSESDSDDDTKPPKKAQVHESSDESSDDSEDEPEPKQIKGPAPAKKDSDNEEDDESSEESSDDEVQDKKPTKAPSGSITSEEESSEEEDSSEESEDEKTPKKDKDVEMVDAPSAKGTSKSEKKAPQTPVTAQTQASGSKTLFVGNLSYDAGEDDVAEFFKEAGEVVAIRLATSEDGRFRGFGHVDFASSEEAQKALELNGHELFGRGVRLELARERGAQTPQSGRESYQKGNMGQGQTIFVKGFDKTQDEDQIRGSLEEHFKSCGEITRISIPKDYESGASKGIAYMDFKDNDAVSRAFELDGSEIDGYTLKVDEPRPRNDNRDGGFSGGRGGGGFSGGRGGGGFSSGRGGRDSGGRGRFGGRGGRGRGGRGEGRGGGRGGRGGRQSFGASSTGKKTTFGDD